MQSPVFFGTNFSTFYNLTILRYNMNNKKVYLFIAKKAISKLPFYIPSKAKVSVNKFFYGPNGHVPPTEYKTHVIFNIAM